MSEFGPEADLGYWVCMFISGNVGHRDRRLLLAQHGPRRRWSVNPALAHRGGVVPGRTRWARLLLLPFYWLTVVLIRAAGTAVGDFISGRSMLGLPVSTAVTGALFIALLVIWREQSRSERERSPSLPDEVRLAP